MNKLTRRQTLKTVLGCLGLGCIPFLPKEKIPIRAVGVCGMTNGKIWKVEVIPLKGKSFFIGNVEADTINEACLKADRLASLNFRDIRNS